MAYLWMVKKNPRFIRGLSAVRSDAVRVALKVGGNLGLYFLADLIFRSFARRVEKSVTYISGYQLEVDLADYTQRRIWAESFENRECFFIRKLLRPGDFAIDVGSNVGFISLVMAGAVGPSGRVLSFEPVPSTFRLLLRTLESNRLSWVTPYQFAVGDSSKKISLYQPESRSGDASSGFWTSDGQSHPDTQARKVFSIEVQQRRLDDLLGSHFRDWPIVKILKIDVEGMELPVLSGIGSRLNPENIHHILFESTIGPRGLGAQSRLVIDLLESRGYEVAKIGRDGNLNYPKRKSGMRSPVTTVINLVALAPQKQ